MKHLDTFYVNLEVRMDWLARFKAVLFGKLYAQITLPIYQDEEGRLEGRAVSVVLMPNLLPKKREGGYASPPPPPPEADKL